MPEARAAAVWPLVAFPALKLAVYLACTRRMAWGRCASLKLG